MNKKMKKLFSSLISASLIASSIVVPLTANAEGESAPSVVITYADGKATVSSDASLKGVLAAAKYAEDGSMELSSLVLSEIDTEAGKNVVAVAEGSKIMLWDSVGGMKPLTAAVTAVEPTPTPTPDVDVTPTPTPTSTPNPDGVIQTWKFNFSSAEKDGYTTVATDRNYMTTKDYGFLGIDEEDYRSGDRLDAFGMQKGQKIELTANENGVGSTGADLYNNAGDKYYPVRFALAAADDTYYKVKATVTTLDATKDAEVSVYTERKHPIITDTKLAAGEKKTVEFAVRPTAIYYQKSSPEGAIADGMVNVAVLGENSALVDLEIQQVESLPTFWVLGDSTVTDGNCALPFFRGQNYTGVGTGLTKYLPTNFAMVNEGEGGLNAADSLHFNMVKDRIKAGDYLYVEYGHNHKDTGGAPHYLSCLDKYYNLCHEKGAYLIIVSPIERINTFTDGAYQHSLRDYAVAGEEYVANKVVAGATDIAYVDLNKYSIDFYNKITTDNGGDADAIKYYFRTGKGGGTDTTHPNDSGAENLAYEFIKAAQAVTDPTQKAVLDGFLNNLTGETPNLVKEEITSSKLGGDAWPTYIVPTDNDYPVVIKDIKVADGMVNYAKVVVQDAKIDFATYGIIVITVYDENGNEKGKIYAEAQVDNSTGKGPQEIVNFRADDGLTIGETDTYTAVVLQADDTDEGLKVTENGTVYSAVYVPTDVDTLLVTNESGDGPDDFNYYGVDDGVDIVGHNNWDFGGSSGKDNSIHKDESGEFNYLKISGDAVKNGAANQGSFYLVRKFATGDSAVSIGTTGSYVVEFDAKYVSGLALTVGFVDGFNPTSAPWGTQSLGLFNIEKDGKVFVGSQEAGQISATAWSPVKCILDMDNATVSVSVGGGDAVTVEVPNYATLSKEVLPTALSALTFTGNKQPIEINIANLNVAKLKDKKLADRTITVKTEGEEKGSVSIVNGEEAVSTLTTAMNSLISIKAEAKEGYVFNSWKDADGNIISYNDVDTIRLHKDIELTATFDVLVVDPITYLYNENFTKLETLTLDWSKNAGRTIEVDSNPDIAKYLHVVPNSSSGNRSAYKALPTEAQVGGKLAMTFNLKLTQSSSRPNQFAIVGSGVGEKKNDFFIDSFVLSFSQSTNTADFCVNANGIENQSMTGEQLKSTGYTAGTWMNVTAIMDFDAKTVDVKATSLDGATTYVEGTVTMADGVTAIGAMQATTGRGQGVVGLDNIRLFTADQLEAAE